MYAWYISENNSNIIEMVIFYKEKIKSKLELFNIIC